MSSTHHFVALTYVRLRDSRKRLQDHCVYRACADDGTGEGEECGDARIVFRVASGTPESAFPTASPTNSPTASPTTSPTASPTTSPTANPTMSPSLAPTLSSPTIEPDEAGPVRKGVTYVDVLANDGLAPGGGRLRVTDVFTRRSSSGPTEDSTRKPTRSPASTEPPASTDPPTGPFPTYFPTYMPTSFPTFDLLPLAAAGAQRGGSGDAPASQVRQEVASAEGGACAVVGDRSRLRYTAPRASFAGADSCAYEACDDRGRCGTARVTFRVVKTANPTRGPTADPTLFPTANPTANPTLAPTLSRPAVNPDAAGPVRRGVAFVDVLANDVAAVGGGRLRVTDAFTREPAADARGKRGDNAGGPARRARETAASVRGGVCAVTGNRSRLRYEAPAAPFVGEDSCAYEACDDRGRCGTASVTLAVVRTASPTKRPTRRPTERPTVSPTLSPTLSPSTSPTTSPTLSPSADPTAHP